MNFPFKLRIFLAAIMFETFENQLLTLYCQFPQRLERNCWFICFFVLC